MVTGGGRRQSPRLRVKEPGVRLRENQQFADCRVPKKKKKTLLGKTGSYEQLCRKEGEEARKKAEGCPQGKREADRKETEYFSDQES